jgi:hypothetical protein
MIKKIFIVGCGRSGTTLVQAIIGSYPEVFTHRETHFFEIIRRPWPWNYIDHLLINNSRLQKALNIINENNELLASYRIGKVNTLKAASMLFDKLFTTEALKRGKSCWLEKTPTHLAHVKLISSHIPDAVFIHVLRDGRDVVASLYDAAQKYPEVWGRYGYDNIYSCISVYNKCVKESLKYRDSRKHFLVWYEDVIEEPEITTKNILEFCRLPYHGFDPMRVNSNSPDIVRKTEGWKMEIPKGIKDTRLKKYNMLFSEKQKSFIETQIIFIDKFKKETVQKQLQKLFPKPNLPSRKKYMQMHKENSST